MNRMNLSAAMGLLFTCGIGAAMAQLAQPAQPAPPAQAAAPPAGYALDDRFTSKSPDGATTIEVYGKDAGDEGYQWQFWVRRQDTLSLLDPKPADYPAGFRFTNDSQWVVRMQKTGSGELTSYLYHLGPSGFAPATNKPLGDLAWAYFNSSADSRKIMKPDFHFVAGLVKGVDDNYAWMGEKWPDSRYLVITLSGEVSPTRKHGQIASLRGWHCRYDLQTGKFDVPPDFAKNNADAIAPPPDR